MRHVLVALSLTLYPGLLLGVAWVPSSGPRTIMELSVAKNGSFTTSSWLSETVSKGSIDCWNADLTHRKTIRLHGYLDGWAHAISANAESAAATTTDGRSRWIEVVRVADNKPIETLDRPDQGLATRIFFCGDHASTFLIADGDSAYVCTRSQPDQQKIQAKEANPQASSGSRYFSISHLQWGATDSTGEPQLDKSVRFYASDQLPLRLMYQVTRSTEAWENNGTAIGSNGTIAVQFPDRIQFRHVDGSHRKLDLVMATGKLWRFDPTMQYLLLHDGRTVTIVDARDGDVMASRKLDDHWSYWQCIFQDPDHLLFSENFNGTPRDSVTGRIVRWHWPTDTVSAVSIGGNHASVTRQRLQWLGVACLVWFFAASWVGRTSRSWIAPSAVFSGITNLCWTWAVCHPDYESQYCDSVWSLTSVVLTTLWLAVPTLVCLAACSEPGRLTRRLPLLVLAGAICADRIHRLQSEAGWFFPIVMVLVSCWLVTASLIGPQVQSLWAKLSAGRRMGQQPTPRTAMRLVDLLLLIGAMAVAMSIASKFDRFDLDQTSTLWALAASIVMASMTGIGVWSSVSVSSWWLRYPTAIGITLVIAWLLGRVKWIDAGAQAALLNGAELAILVMLFTAVVAYASWLFRGLAVSAAVSRINTTNVSPGILVISEKSRKT